MGQGRSVAVGMFMRAILWGDCAGGGSGGRNEAKLLGGADSGSSSLAQTSARG